MKRKPEPDDTFEKLVVWQRAQALAVRVYRLLASCKDFGFRNQMTDAVNSISNNIAEGVERLTRAEFRQFLGYAKGSAGETRSQTYTAEDLGYIDADECVSPRIELKEISKMLKGLIRSMEPSRERTSST